MLRFEQRRHAAFFRKLRDDVFEVEPACAVDVVVPAGRVVKIARLRPVCAALVSEPLPHARQHVLYRLVLDDANAACLARLGVRVPLRRGERDLAVFVAVGALLRPVGANQAGTVRDDALRERRNRLSEPCVAQRLVDAHARGTQLAFERLAPFARLIEHPALLVELALRLLQQGHLLRVQRAGHEAAHLLRRYVAGNPLRLVSHPAPPCSNPRSCRQATTAWGTPAAPCGLRARARRMRSRPS